MPPFPKASNAIIERFATLVPDDARIEQRTMFGCRTALVGGRTFMVLWGDRIALELSDADRTKLLAVDGAEPWSPMGRAAMHKVLVPQAMMSDDEALRRWIARAFAHVGALPAKPEKAAAIRRPKKTGKR